MRCIGFAGRLFGHKFVKFGWVGNGQCYRCGVNPDCLGCAREEA